MRQSYRGFTIVELLIVIVVIGILAALVISTFSGVQNRAHDSGVESDASSITKFMEIAKVDLGRYPETNAEMPKGFRFTKGVYDPTQNNVYYCVDKENQRYAFGLRSRSMRGYIVSTGAVYTRNGISGAITCSEIGKTWTNDATTAVIQGYVGSTQVWNTSWDWTK